MSDAKQFIVGGVPVSVKDEVARESIGDLSELTTSNKSNLVEAINEAAQSGSGEGSDPEAVKYTSQSLTTAQKNQARTNIGAASSGDIPSVPVISTDISADAASDLKTASPKAVKTYVDAHGGSGTDPEAVKYTSQSLTSSQKEQARDNIGAASEEEILDDVTASVLDATGVPSVEVTKDYRSINLVFSGLKGADGNDGAPGQKGDTGATGPAGVTSASATVDSNSGTPSVAVSLVNGELVFAFQNLKGQQGNTGSSVDYAFTLVNNLTTDDATQALSAAMGKLLKDIVDSHTYDLGDLRASTSSADLEIADGNGNTLAEIKEGNIRLKNFDSRQINDLSIANSSDADISISDDEGNVLVRLAEGNIQTKNFNSANVFGKKQYSRETYFKTNIDCVQMNASSFVATNPNNYVSQVLYQDNAVLILPPTYSQNGEPTRLIIFCKQGNNQITDSANPILTSNAMGNIFHFLLARGYAILGADGVPDGLSTSLGLDDTRVSGNYVAVQSTRKAYDYVVKNYNICDDGAFIFGYSQGGMYAQNVIDLSGIPFLGCAMVSPALSMRYHLWDLASSKTIDGVSWTRTSRLNIARLYGFDAVATNAQLLALEFDKEKVAGYDPWNRNVENPYEGFTQSSSYGDNLWALPSGASIDSITMKKKIGCPTKIWVAENDATLGADVTKVFVKAARNAGQVCDLHLYNDGNHHIFQNTYQSPAISTFVDDGSTYNLYPIAYEMASFFYRLGGLSL